MTRVVVVPYRNRPNQLKVLIPYLQKKFDRVIISEQNDNEPFNRGWVKNRGYWAAKVNPDDIIYFHDVDIVPLGDYIYPNPTSPKTIMHLYGHFHCLGGIIGMYARDFMCLNGFPHLDHWGGEDTSLQARAELIGFTIDRRYFVQRFSLSGMIFELDEDGSFMDQDVAREKFFQKIKNEIKITRKKSSPGQLHEAKNSNHKKIIFKDVCDNVEWFLV